VSEQNGRFVWYELLTTDAEAAASFYGRVVGWRARDASTPGVPYTMWAAGSADVAGLMVLPEEGRRMGAAPRWVGYVAVDDIDATAERVRQLGGSVYVPPTDSNIGRVSVIADPQTATLALVGGLKPADGRLPDREAAGHVGWHELFASDHLKAFAFYREIFGWQTAAGRAGSMDGYQPFAAGGQTIGGMFTKLPQAPVPYWLYYVNTDNLAAALGRVKAAGGRIFDGPFELHGDISIARCVDPQGALFALQGPHGGPAGEPDELEIGWSTQYGGISSHGRLVSPNSKRKR
jgi:predicted enzyme related to lactoylglutathione lyase